MVAVYEYQQSSRRPVIWLVQGAFSAALLAGIGFGAPWIVWGILALGIAMATWSLIFKRTYGCRILPEAVETYVNDKVNRIDRSEIQAYRVKEWMEGPDDIYLVLMSGKEVLMQAFCIGTVRNFKTGLEAVGIKRQRS